MSKVSSNHPQKSPAASAPNKVSRPGWSEIIVGLVVFAIAGFGCQPAHGSGNGVR